MTGKTERMVQVGETGPVSGLDSWGVVFLAHGSRRGADRSECSCAWVGSGSTPPEWCLKCPSTPQGLQEAAGRLQTLLGLQKHQVVLSCLEFIEPFPEQAVRLLEERGFRRVVLLPFLLGSGKHATIELEEVVEAMRVAAPGIQIHLAGGLGADSLLADLVVQRVRGMGASAPLQPGAGRTAGVLLVKAGTKTMYDDCRWLEELGRMVEDRLGPGHAVAVAQSHYGDPTMEAAAERLIEERQASSILYVPYLLFPGLILKRNVLGGMTSLQERYPGTAMAVTPPLGADGQVVAVAAQRVRELWDRTTGAGP